MVSGSLIPVLQQVETGLNVVGGDTNPSSLKMPPIEIGEANNRENRNEALVATQQLPDTNRKSENDELVASHESVNEDDASDFSTLIDSESEHEGKDEDVLSYGISLSHETPVPGASQQNTIAYQRRKRNKDNDLDLGVMKDEYSKAAVHTVVATKCRNHPEKDLEMGVMKDQYSRAAINSSQATDATNTGSGRGSLHLAVHDLQRPPPSTILLDDDLDDTATLFSAELVNLESDRQQLVEQVLQAIHHQAVSATEVFVANEDYDENSNSNSHSRSHKSKNDKVHFRLYALVAFLLLLIGILVITVGVTLKKLMNHQPVDLLPRPTVSPTTKTISQGPTSPTPTFPNTRNPSTYMYEMNVTKAVFQNVNELYLAVDTYMEVKRTSINPGHSEVAKRYGYPIGIWNVSLIRDFSRVFDPLRRKEFFEVTEPVHHDSYGTELQPVITALALFNEDLSGWDVSNATTMFGMFARAESFEGAGIERWKVGHVRDFSYMFFGATSFDGNVSSWDTSGCSNMSSMFSFATKFNGDVSNWNTIRVKNMDYTFANATKFEGNTGLNTWNVSNVNSMIATFQGAEKFNGNISLWDTSKVVDMSRMFELANVFNGDLSSWSVGSVQKLSSMFHSANSFEGGDLSQWDTSAVTDMKGAFHDAINFTGTIDRWNVSNVKQFGSMFDGADKFNGNLSMWDTSSAEAMNSMFASAFGFEGHGLSNWNTGNVVTVSSQFFESTVFNSNISNWDTRSVEDMSDMFMYASSFNRDISKWNVSKVITMSNMFANAEEFNQSLCPWNALLVATTNVDFMFENSGCLIQDDPLVGRRSASNSQYDESTTNTSFCTPC